MSIQYSNINIYESTSTGTLAVNAGNITVPNTTSYGLQDVGGTAWFRPRDTSNNLHIRTSSGGIYLDTDGTHYFRTTAGTNRGYLDGTNGGGRLLDSTTYSYAANMNQNVRTTDSPTFNALTVATLNTGQGANELYAMDQNVRTTDAVTFATVNTGQGANELYAMNQNVRTTDSPTFATVTAALSGNATTATSSPLLSALGNYVWSAATLPTSFSAGIQSSFVSATEGFPSYGSVMMMRTYSGGGGSLQLYTPYSTIYGGSRLGVRFGDYNVSSGNSWTGWKYLLDSSSDPYAYNMNQNVRTTDAVTFATVDTGQGATEVHLMNQNVRTTDSPTFNALTVATLNTGQGANELYAMDQNVRTTDSPTFNALTVATLNTGQGANELYAMNQNVRTTDSPTFVTVTAALSGNATTATTATTANNVSGLTITNSSNGINPDSVTQNQIGYNTSVSLFGQTDGGLYSSAYSSAWIHQIYGDFRTGQIAIRGKNNGTWQAWRVVLDSSNYNSYSPTLTGGGASGTWGIAISGNAATATNATNASNVTHNSARTDSAYYNVGWFASTPSPAYSCDVVQIQSSTGTLRATTLNASGASYSGTAGFATGNNQWTWSTTAHQYLANSMRIWDQYSTNGGASGYPTTYGTIFHISGRTGHMDSQWYMGAGGELLYRYCFYGTDTWNAWQTLLTSTNYNSYSPTLTGGGASGTWNIAISGNAATATTAGALTSMNISQFTNNSGYITGISFANVSSKPTTLSGYGITDALYQAVTGVIDVNAFNATGLYRGSTGSWTNRPTVGNNAGALLQIDTHPGNYHTQLFFDTANNRLYMRSANPTTWGTWVTMLHSSNYNSYSPTLTGGGASGTWGISISGNAATATSVTTAVNVSGVVAVANGGTASTTRIAASNSVANFGQLQGHGTFTDANAVQQWGHSYIQGSTNTPNYNGATQHYNMILSLGSDYDWGTGNTYAAQFVFARNVSTPYIGIRYKEGGANTGGWGGWNKIAAGYADSAGSAGSVTHNSGRTDGTYYNVGWFSGSPSPAYSCNAVQIQSSTGTLSATQIIETSSERYKENIFTLSGALDKVISLRGVEYNRIGSTTKEIGVIAEEVEKILPEVVKYNNDNVIDAVSYGRITALLIEAMKELKLELDSAKKEISELKNKLTEK